MKKFLMVFVLLLFSNSVCFADDLILDKETQYQKKIMEIGFTILNANRIEKRVTFNYNNSKSVNAVAYGTPKAVIVYKGIIPYFDDDNELAGILGHEIAHQLDFHDGVFKRYSMALSPKKYEEKADKKAVDLMVNAGYNPVAMIIVLNKIADQPNWFEFSATHPRGSKRLAYVYEYIYKKYPAYLVDNEYKTNIYYQNFLLTSKKDREKIRNSQTSVTNKQVKEKI